ncbi:translesion DNA synthesis-associated protein ImuA [Dokdonella soli]|uniref:Translesion DNA synthesis-associated protein ImuA n=1 Tax=Dokdonella soli TaxID=529810 RepID=A0ABN1IQZ5_9GAMM
MFTSSSPDVSTSFPESADFARIAPTSPRTLARPALAPASVRPARDETALAGVLRHPGIWRRSTSTVMAVDAQPTGLAELDALLPGGGWPRGALSEILIEQDGIGECSLVLPALAALTQARRRIALVAPPYIPYAPALAAAGIDLAQLVHIDAGATDTHWTAEQCLRAGCCGAVLNWLPNVDYRQLRRLQLAAETGAAIGFVFRPLGAASQTSPAALRLMVTASENGPRIEILKCRGRIDGRTQAIRLRA